ncbi:MAG: hypothetical protein IJN92_09360 [Lachnospiraceae bacterium]|nr:hypothetical protein [Lachnospiraceae bacterium]
MKRKLVLLALVSMSVFTGCSSSTSSRSTDKLISEELVAEPQKEDKESEPTSEEDIEDVSAVDKFVELYNENAESPITDLIDIDIQDKSSGYYRTEFRTYAYNDAIAKHGIAGENVSMDLIQYSHGFRIYVLADSYEELQKVLRLTIKIYDPTIMDDTIQSEIYEKIDFVGSGVSFYINDVTGYYEILNRETGSCSVMLDSSPAVFIE